MNPYMEGYLAYVQGKVDNPYLFESAEWCDWEDGYEDGMFDYYGSEDR